MDCGPKIRRELHYGRLVPTFADRPPTVDAMFKARVSAGPDATAIVDGDRRLSYRELDQEVDRLADGLSSRGIRKGGRVATVTGNRCETIVVSLACGRLGAIHVPLDLRLRAPEIAYALNQSGTRLLIHTAAQAGSLPEDEAIPGVRDRFVVDGEAVGAEAYANLRQAPQRGEAYDDLSEEDPFCILYTSGTTGLPKGATLTHLGVIHSCLHYRYALELSSCDRIVLAVPSAHLTGLIGVVHGTLAAGACLIVMAQFKARAFLELAARERMTGTIMVPAMYNLCLLDPDFAKFDLATWRIGAFGGAPMPEPNARRLKEACPRLTLHNVYGATETSSPVAILPRDAPPERLGSVGKPVHCVDIRIMDEDGREVSPGDPGEIWIGGASVVPGYWRNPEADALAFPGGYWRSGDVGSLDREGYLTVFDRKKDMINRGGFKIYSAEVETVLADHPAVSEAAVVGYPDPVLGERVAAFVTARGIDSETLRSHCAARLADYKVPERFTVLPDGLPRNPNGKIIKAVLRDQAASAG